MSDAGRRTAELAAELEKLRGHLAAVLAENEALSRSEERYRVLFESMHDFVAELDGEGRVLFVGPACEAIIMKKNRKRRQLRYLLTNSS